MISDNFKVKVTKAFWAEKVELAVTHNGHQWTCISLIDEEVPLIIAELQKYFDETQKAKCEHRRLNISFGGIFCEECDEIFEDNTLHW